MTSMTPPISFKYSRQTEAGRLLFTCASLTHTFHHVTLNYSFYLNHNFYVLPYLPQNPPSNLVYLPHLSYNQLDDFWDTVAQVTPHLPFNSLTHFNHQLQSHLDYQPHTLQQIQTELQTTIQNYFPSFWQTLNSIFPQRTQLVKQIIIYPTLYGSGASFSELPRQDQTIHLYFRQQTNHLQFFKAILFAILRNPAEKLYSSWSAINTTINFILQTSVLADLLPSSPISLSQPTKHKQLGTYAKETLDYIMSLSVNRFKLQPLKLKNNQITYHNKSLNHLFGQKELQLLTLLLQHRNQIISIDQLLDTLYPQDYEATEWRITKLVQRIRHKLSQQDLPANTIQTIRGTGYLLV